MAESFTKLFSSIVTSTVWSQDSDTKVVWITLLAMADKNGEVQGSVPGLARLAGVTVEACERALQHFQEPDKYSRSKDHEGRRIEDIPGGWALLNYAKYRKMASVDDQMEKSAARSKRYRERRAANAGVTDRDASRPDTPVTTEAEGDAEAESEPKGSVRRKRAAPLNADWQPSPEQINYATRQGCPSPTDTATDFKEYWISRGGRMVDWNLTWQTWCRRESHFKPRAPQRPSQGGFNL